MKVIAIGAVTAGGKTTVVNALKERLPKAEALYFDDYSFEGEEEAYAEIMNGTKTADYDVWNLSPLKADAERIINSGECDCLLLDYPFAYRNSMMKDMIDCCIFIDTPLDIAMARRVLRDMKDASADEIRGEMESYLKYARIGYIQMLENVLPSSDYVIDGSKEITEIVGEVLEMIGKC